MNHQQITLLSARSNNDSNDYNDKNERDFISAINQGAWEKVFRLIDKADIDIETVIIHGIHDDRVGGKTALMIAVETVDETEVAAIIGQFLKRGANINAQDTRGSSIVARACDLDQWETVKVLLQCGSNVNTITYGRSLLSIASQKDRLDIVSFLLDGGATVKERDMISAIGAKQHAFEIIQLMVKANYYQVDNAANLMDMACEKGKTQIVKYFRSLGMPMTEADDVKCSLAVLKDTGYCSYWNNYAPKPITAFSLYYDHDLEQRNTEQVNRQLFDDAMIELRKFIITDVQDGNILVGAWLAILRNLLRQGFDFPAISYLSDKDKEILCKLASGERSLIGQSFDQQWHYIKALHEVDTSLYLNISSFAIHNNALINTSLAEYDSEKEVEEVVEEEANGPSNKKRKLKAADHELTTIILEIEVGMRQSFHLSLPISMTLQTMYDGIQVTNFHGQPQKFLLRSKINDFLFTKRFFSKTIKECVSIAEGNVLIVERNEMSDTDLIALERVLEGEDNGDNYDKGMVEENEEVEGYTWDSDEEQCFEDEEIEPLVESVV